MDITQLASNVGFPIALAVYLLQRDSKTQERMIKALEKAAEVIGQNTKILEKLQDKK